MSWRQNRSRNGWSTTRRSSSPTTGPDSPSANLASTKSSIATSRSSSSRTASPRAHSRSANSSNAGPLHNAERVAEQLDDLSRRRRRVRVADELGESRGVDAVGGSLQEVARCTTEDVDVGRERLAEPRHVALDGGDRRRGRSVSPERVGEPVDRHDRPPVREQHRQREPGLRSTDRDHRPAPPVTSSGPSTLTNSSTTRASSPCLQAAASRLASRTPADSRELARGWVHAGSDNRASETIDNEGERHADGAGEAGQGCVRQDQKQEMIHKITETMVGIEGETLRPVTWSSWKRSRAATGASAVTGSPPRTSRTSSRASPDPPRGLERRSPRPEAASVRARVSVLSLAAPFPALRSPDRCLLPIPGSTRDARSDGR